MSWYEYCDLQNMDDLLVSYAFLVSASQSTVPVFPRWNILAPSGRKRAGASCSHVVL